MNKTFREILSWILILIPLAYLMFIYPSLPAIVPTHFDIDGNPNDWSKKSSLIWIIAGLNIGIYLLFLVLPKIDPKKKIEESGEKYGTIRFMVGLFISLLSCYVLYLTKEGNAHDTTILFALIGGLFAVLGNYFQTLRPNYFIGIRTPWTLENEDTWKSTHRIGGYTWMIGGILIILSSFILKNNHAFNYLFAFIVSMLVLIPIVYSYLEYKKHRRESIQ